MKVGDLVKVSACFEGKLHCECFFCAHNSNRVGIVVADERMAPAEEGIPKRLASAVRLWRVGGFSF